MLALNGAAPGATAPLLLEALARPLAPQMGDSAALCVGPALLALLSAAPAEAALAVPSLLAALAAKIAAAEVSPVLTGAASTCILVSHSSSVT